MLEAIANGEIDPEDLEEEKIFVEGNDTIH
jgi:hypothetical protein